MNGLNFDYQKYRNSLSDHERKHAPADLYLDGNPQFLVEGVRVSVVGARKPSPEGIKRTMALTQALVEHGIIVVSGLAEGIDTIAHQTAISRKGKTIAVLGSPLNVCYPKGNELLLDEIKQNHLAISQFPIGYPITQRNFPMRNRTMALISDATIIVEAGETSGTIHQGWKALRIGRYLYLLNNIIENVGASWPKDMLKYGAQVLRKEDLAHVLDEIPSFTASINAEVNF